MVKGLSMRIEKIAWDYNNKMEETQNLKTYKERISNTVIQVKKTDLRFDHFFNIIYINNCFFLISV